MFPPTLLGWGSSFCTTVPGGNNASKEMVLSRRQRGGFCCTRHGAATVTEEGDQARTGEADQRGFGAGNVWQLLRRLPRHRRKRRRPCRFGPESGAGRSDQVVRQQQRRVSGAARFER